MKLLLLLSAFVYHVHAQGNVVRTCIEGDQDFACSIDDSVCKVPNAKITCPNLCDLCDTSSTEPTAVFSKIDCPIVKPSNEENVYCWKVTWNNEKASEDETDVFFYPNIMDVNGVNKTVGYIGVMLDDEAGSIFGVGDIEHGTEDAAFGINSSFTDDKRVQYTGSGRAVQRQRPIFSSQFKSVPAGSSDGGQVSSRSAGLESKLVARKLKQKIPLEGFEIYVQPVVDKRLQMIEGNKRPINPIDNVEEYAMSLVEFAAHTFLDPSLEVPVYIKSRPTIRYDKNVTVGSRGYGNIISAQGFNFAKHYRQDKMPNTSVFLFMTETPIDDIDAEFNLVYARKGGVCNKAFKERVAIIENYESLMDAGESATKAIAMVLGIGYDYINGSIEGDPTPRFINGENCTKVGGYMDYYRDANRWTRCSNSDLKMAVKDGKLDCLIEECQDAIYNCDQLDDTECSFVVAEVNCRKTCGYCGEMPEPKCEDFGSICNIGNNKTLVTNHICPRYPGLCRMTCKLCKQKVSS